MFETLQVYCAESGQKVNDNKSRIWYLPMTPMNVKAVISSNMTLRALVISTNTWEFHYAMDGCNNKHYDYLIDKVKTRLNGWKSSPV